MTDKDVLKVAEKLQNKIDDILGEGCRLNCYISSTITSGYQAISLQIVGDYVIKIDLWDSESSSAYVKKEVLSICIDGIRDLISALNKLSKL